MPWFDVSDGQLAYRGRIDRAPFEAWIATPEGQSWRHDSGNAGLATSGSGDALAGLIAGLAARGASLQQACVWGVALHARAGRALALQRGPLGFLAGELAAEVPRLMDALGHVEG